MCFCQRCALKFVISYVSSKNEVGNNFFIWKKYITVFYLWGGVFNPSSKIEVECSQFWSKAPQLKPYSRLTQNLQSKPGQIVYYLVSLNSPVPRDPEQLYSQFLDQVLQRVRTLQGKFWLPMSCSIKLSVHIHSSAVLLCTVSWAAVIIRVVVIAACIISAHWPGKIIIFLPPLHLYTWLLPVLPCCIHLYARFRHSQATELGWFLLGRLILYFCCQRRNSIRGLSKDSLRSAFAWLAHLYKIKSVCILHPIVSFGDLYTYTVL